MKKKLQELIKMEIKSQEPYPTDYNLLKAKDLCQDHYQIPLIIFLKEFIKLNVNTDTMRENIKLVKLYTKVATAFLNRQALNII